MVEVRANPNRQPSEKMSCVRDQSISSGGVNCLLRRVTDPAALGRKTTAGEAFALAAKLGNKMMSDVSSLRGKRKEKEDVTAKF